MLSKGAARIWKQVKNRLQGKHTSRDNYIFMSSETLLETSTLV